MRSEEEKGGRTNHLSGEILESSLARKDGHSNGATCETQIERARRERFKDKRVMHGDWEGAKGPKKKAGRGTSLRATRNKEKFFT